MTEVILFEELLKLGITALLQMVGRGIIGGSRPSVIGFY